jgi:chaperone required for assembly of F1-ATPase
MREVFDNPAPQNPIEAARRGARPPLPKRFYDRATVASTPQGYALRLDAKPVRTPAGRLLAAPTGELAQALAAEWDAQRDVIDPSEMPLTRLANSIIDGVADRPDAVQEEVEKYLGSDLVCYRADAPRGLVERQSKHWDPILDWAREALGANFAVGEGVIHVAQSDDALAAAAAAIPSEPWRLGAVHAATTLTGSALLALALAQGALSADDAWTAAHVDEDWNIEQWGSDDEAMARRSFREAEFRAAAKVLGAV